MGAFHNIRLSPKISYGAVGGPMRRTDIVTLANGFEERNSPWAHPRHKYDISYGIRSLNQAQEVIAFFQARYAKLYGFLYKDWGDYKSCPHSEQVSATNMFLGTGDGVTRTFQLTKTYNDAAGSYVRTITRPVESSVRIAIDGIQLPQNDYIVDPSTGWVLLLVAADMLVAGANITAGFEFDVPVRFDVDWLGISLDNFDAGAIQSISLLEIKMQTTNAPDLDNDLEDIFGVYSCSELVTMGNALDYTVNTHWETTWI